MSQVLSGERQDGFGGLDLSFFYGKIFYGYKTIITQKASVSNNMTEQMSFYLMPEPY